MTDAKDAVLEYLRHIGAGLDPDFLREAIKVMSALLMEVEVQQQIGADRYERTDQRTTYRNGYRDRAWNTRGGELFPEPARTPTASGTDIVRSDPRSLYPRREIDAGRKSPRC